MIWEDVSLKDQSSDLHVIKQLIINDCIVAQIWQHNEESDIGYSINTYEDEDQGNLDGNEYFGSIEELINLAEQTFP